MSEQTVGTAVRSAALWTLGIVAGIGLIVGSVGGVIALYFAAPILGVVANVLVIFVAILALELIP